MNAKAIPADSKYKVGEIVRVVKYTPRRYAPGVKDELGTERLFRSLVGNRYRVYGIDRYRHLELRPTPKDSVWIGAEDVRRESRALRGNGGPRKMHKRTLEVL